MIVEGLPEGMSWIQSLRVHILRNVEADKWFRRENFAEIRNPLTVEAISTLFPNQCLAGDAIKLSIESFNLVVEPDTYFADVLVSQLPASRILRIFRRKIQQSNQKVFNRILVPINVKSTHCYLGVLQRQEAGEYRSLTQNNCMTIRNEQAESNLRIIGKTLSLAVLKSSEDEMPI